MKETILEKIPTECPWRDTLYWYASLDSTNTKAKALARAGAPHGTVVIAGNQTAGRGRMGRSFHSPAGSGIYLSVILRPLCPPNQLMHLTCAVAVAMCDAVEKTAGIRPGIKWINDLVLKDKKLGGILTELAIDPRTGLTDYAVVGIGINCCQQSKDFPPELQEIATSLLSSGFSVSTDTLAAEMITALHRMDATLLTGKKQLMARYRADCITLGKDITVHSRNSVRPGKALDLDENGGLVVAFPDGTKETVSSGEVSVRGLYNYI